MATIHRAENVDDPERLHTIMEALNRVAHDLPVVLPLHPRTKHRLSRLSGPWCFMPRASLFLVDPVGYLDMTVFEKNAAVIATDSGGLQKEAFFHGVPCVTLRDETEWVELVRLGWNTLMIPDSVEAIVKQIHAGIESKPFVAENPYGIGDSAERILNTLREL